MVGKFYFFQFTAYLYCMKAAINKGSYAGTKWDRMWVVPDLDNGHPGKAGKGYVWIFPTKKAAIEHKRAQRKMKYAASLGKPFMVRIPKPYYK